ncbi:hypothetical protein EON66_07370 [archaeon]|nr:MAG: hypothetical protein EON66_07370 [archaeon]
MAWDSVVLHAYGTRVAHLTNFHAFLSPPLCAAEVEAHHLELRHDYEGAAAKLTAAGSWQDMNGTAYSYWGTGFIALPSVPVVFSRAESEEEAAARTRCQTGDASVHKAVQQYPGIAAMHSRHSIVTQWGMDSLSVSGCSIPIASQPGADDGAGHADVALLPSDVVTHSVTAIPLATPTQFCVINADAAVGQVLLPAADYRVSSEITCKPNRMGVPLFALVPELMGLPWGQPFGRSYQEEPSHVGVAEDVFVVGPQKTGRFRDGNSEAHHSRFRCITTTLRTPVAARVNSATEQVQPAMPRATDAHRAADALLAGSNAQAWLGRAAAACTHRHPYFFGVYLDDTGARYAAVYEPMTSSRIALPSERRVLGMFATATQAALGTFSPPVIPLLACVASFLTLVPRRVLTGALMCSV